MKRLCEDCVFKGQSCEATLSTCSSARTSRLLCFFGPKTEAQEAVPQSHLTGDEALLYRRGKEYLFIPKEKPLGLDVEENGMETP